MTTETKCQFCGASIEDSASTNCPACGAALSKFMDSAATIMSPRSAFESSAQAMDELKNQIQNGNQEAAESIASSEFGLNQEAAQGVVEQTMIDMKHSGYGSTPATPEDEPAPSKPEVIDAPGYEEVKKPSNKKNWIIGGSIAAVVFLCCCCCLPFIATIAFFISKAK